MKLSRMNGALTIGNGPGIFNPLIDKGEVGDKTSCCSADLPRAGDQGRRQDYQPDLYRIASTRCGKFSRYRIRTKTAFQPEFEPDAFYSAHRLFEICWTRGCWPKHFESFMSTPSSRAGGKHTKTGKEQWLIGSILNTACSGKFSTDWTMHDYNCPIWELTPVLPIPTPVNGEDYPAGRSVQGRIKGPIWIV